jgi:hypothetical protein
MNVKEIKPQATSLWVYLVIAIPLTLVSIIVLANWKAFNQAWGNMSMRTFVKNQGIRYIIGRRG